MSYSFVMTVRLVPSSPIISCSLNPIYPQTIILWIMHYTPGLRLRCNEETEILGVDDAEMGEFAYDYVGIDYELNASSGGNKPMDDFHGDGLGAVGGGREPLHALSHHARESQRHVHVVAHEDDGSGGKHRGGEEGYRVGARMEQRGESLLLGVSCRRLALRAAHSSRVPHT